MYDQNGYRCNRKSSGRKICVSVFLNISYAFLHDGLMNKLKMYYLKIIEKWSYLTDWFFSVKQNYSYN